MAGITVRTLLDGIVSAVEAVTLPSTDTPEGKAGAEDVFRGLVGFEEIEGEDRVFRVVPGVAVRNHVTSSQRMYKIAAVLVVYYTITETVWDRAINDGILITDALHMWPATQTEVQNLRLSPGTIQAGQTDQTIELRLAMEAVWRWSGP